MSADGEIDIQVRAEGTDEAAAELADGGTGGGGGGGGGGGLSGRAAKAGGLAFVASKIAGPLLDVLGPILDILNAFLAPVAALLLRLLQPVLRQFIALLPYWFDFMDDAMKGIDDIHEIIGTAFDKLIGINKAIAQGTWDAIKAGIGWITNGPMAIAKTLWDLLPSDLSNVAKILTTVPMTMAQNLWSKIKSFPSDFADKLGSVLENKLPSVPNLPGGGNGGGGGGGFPDVPIEPPNVNINLDGKLSSLYTEASRDDNFDLYPN